MELPEFRGTCIYIIWNNSNDRYYVGSAKNYRRRIQKHLQELRLKRHHSYKMQMDWKKNPDNWETFELRRCNYSEAIANEQWCLDILQPYYNILLQAGHGVQWTPEVRKKITNSLKENTEATKVATARCYKLIEQNKVPVIVTNLKTGVETYYNSIIETANGLNVPKSSIRQRLIGQTKQTHYKNKYSFKYASNTNSSNR